MSLRVYASPGNIIFPRPTVLRQYVPGRVSRQVRYTRSLSAPLGLDREFTYSPWNSQRDYTNSFLETKPRDYTNSVLEIKQKNLVNSALESKYRDLTSPFSLHSPLGTNRIPLSESKRREFFSPLGRRELTSSYLENKRRDYTINHFETSPKDFASNHLESGRKDYSNNHFETNAKDFASKHLDNSRVNSHFEKKRTDFATNQTENDKRDLSNGYLENKGKDLSSNHLEAKSRSLIAAPRAIRYWNKEKNLCSPDDLLEIIREPTGQYELPTDPCNEVYPGIILSDGPTALCTAMLKRMGVSHVLNAAQGKERPGQVNTSPSFYTHSRIRYLGVEAFDHIAFRLYPYFEEAADFIQEALDSGGKVLVHCRAGISRSATLVCAFLMLKRHQSVQEAIRTVRKNRPIIPNDGFLQQLCDLNQRLHKTRGP